MNLHDTTPSKTTIHVVVDEGRYGTDTYYFGVPPHIEIIDEPFYFDTHNGEPEIDDIQDQVDRLKVLQGLYPNEEILQSMITDREAWLQKEEERFAAMDAEEAAVRANRLHAARALLREAGELQ